MSAAKKMILVSTLTFLALVVAGAMWGHHGGDPTGTTIPAVDREDARP